MEVRTTSVESQLSRISELVDDLFSTDFSENKNYGIIPQNVLHNVMLYQRLPDLLSMSISCSLFYKVHNSSYFWKSYYYANFKTYPTTNNKNVNWKREFFKRCFLRVYTFGFGGYGVLGHGKTENELIPKLVEKLVPFKIKILSCGYSNCCSVVLSNGDLLSFGLNEYHRLGHEKNDRIFSTPKCLVQLPDNRKINQVTHSYFHSFFLDEIGDVWGCGRNSTGFLTGKKTDLDCHQPVKIEIPGSPKMKKIVSGENHFGCVSCSGKLYIWGNGRDGQLGNGNESDVLQPQIVKHFENIQVKDVSMGYSHTVILCEDGNIFSCGDVLILVLYKYFCDNNIVVTKISCGREHSGCIDSVGNCYMWGRGDEGQIGNGEFHRVDFTPFRISSFIDSSGEKQDLDIPNRHKFVQLECALYHNIALLEEKANNQQKRKTFVLTWGGGEYGRLGLGSEENMNIPTVVPFFVNKIVRGVHSGGEMSVVIL